MFPSVDAESGLETACRGVMMASPGPSGPFGPFFAWRANFSAPHFVTLLPCQTQNSAHASSSSHLLWFPPPSYLVSSLVLGLSVTLSLPTCVGPHAPPVTWHTLSLPVISWFAFSSLSRASSSSCVPELSASSPLQCTFCPSICISHK